MNTKINMNMIIWNPVNTLVSTLASFRQRYCCRVDGLSEYLGESLPTGAQSEILAWIAARYKVLGELYVISPDFYNRSSIGHLVDPDMWETVTMTKRYLVEVDGVEKMFVLEPLHGDLLSWHPERALAWNAEG